MNMTPPPTPIDVTIHSDPAPAWQIIAAYGPLIAAFIALVAAGIAAAGVWQRWRADNRAEWWRRTQWALDASTSGDKKRIEMGQQALAILATSRLATPEDGRMLAVGTEGPLEAAQHAIDVELHGTGTLNAGGVVGEPPAPDNGEDSDDGTGN